MKRAGLLIATFYALMLAVSVTEAQLTVHIGPPEQLVRESTLVYQGAFRLPQGQLGPSTFAYGGRLAYYAPHHSLFVSGHEYEHLVAEVSIPDTPVVTDWLGGLPIANLLQPFADTTDGHFADVNDQHNTGSLWMGGLLVYNDCLIETGYKTYDANYSQFQSHFKRCNLNLSSPTPAAVGPWSIGEPLYGAGPATGFASGWMAHIPAKWQAALGGPALTGNGAISIIARSSFGPAALVFDPSLIGTVTPVPATGLLYYPQGHPTIGAYDSNDTMFNGTASIGGMVIPPGTRSLLFFGAKGIGSPEFPYCYGYGTNNPAFHLRFVAGECINQLCCYDIGEVGGEGTHDYPYKLYVWAYDLADLAAVKRGEKLPWDVVPYATWMPTLPFQPPWKPPLVRGAATDTETGRVFVSALADSGETIVHVFIVKP